MKLDTLIAALASRDPNVRVRKSLRLGKIPRPLPECPHFIINGPGSIGEMLVAATKAKALFEDHCKVMAGKSQYTLHWLRPAELAKLLDDKL